MGRIGRVAAAGQHHPSDDGDHGEHHEGDGQRRGQLGQCGTGEVCGEGVGGGPDDRPRGVEGEEIGVVHPGRPGQEGGVGPQHRDEAAEEDHLAPVALEEISGDLDFRLVEAHQVAVADEQSVAALVPDPVAGRVADDGGGGGHGEDPPDVELPGVAGVDRGGHQGRLPRERHPEALQPDEQGHGEVAPTLDQAVDAQAGDEARGHGRPIGAVTSAEASHSPTPAADRQGRSSSCRSGPGAARCPPGAGRGGSRRRPPA